VYRAAEVFTLVKRVIGIAGTLVVLVAVALLALGVSSRREALPSVTEFPSDALPVDVVLARPEQHYTITRHFTGEVRPRRASELSFPLPGKLDETFVQEGTRVDEGDLLARLDARRLMAERKEIEARKAQAEAVLDELIAGPRAEEIRRARAQVEDVAHELQLSRISLERAEKLFAGSAGSQEDVDQAKTMEQRLEAQLSAAREALDELIAGTRNEQIRAQQAQVDQLAASLEALSVDIEESELRAPFAGRVGVRHHDEGTVLTAGQPVYRLIEDGALEVHVGLPAETAASLDGEGSYGFHSGTGRYTGRFVALLPEVDDATRTVTAIFRLDDEGALPTPGETVSVDLDRSIHAEGFWLPTTALTRGMRGLWACYAVVPDGDGGTAFRIEPRQLEVLYSDGERLFVRGTLSPGDRVVASGTDKLVGGQRVQPLISAAEG
jgi:multidrug efflux pump subunit AcrA (membrane-fusion protein)